jgi:hypothetical protein
MQSLSLRTLMSNMTLVLPIYFISKLYARDLLAPCTISMVVYKINKLVTNIYKQIMTHSLL